MIHPFAHFDYVVTKDLATYATTHDWAFLLTYLAAQILILVYPLVLYILWRQPEVKGEKHTARKAVVMAVIGVVIAFAIKGGISLFFLRDRPFIAHPDIMFMAFNLDQPSFPSGHTLVATVIATSLLWSGYYRLGGWLAVGAVVVGLGRIAAGVHYPTDVLGAMLIGVGIAWYLHREASTLRKYLPNT
jgi:undecaprenyl-diphosphatase